MLFRSGIHAPVDWNKSETNDIVSIARSRVLSETALQVGVRQVGNHDGYVCVSVAALRKGGSVEGFSGVSMDPLSQRGETSDAQECVVTHPGNRGGA